MRIIGKHIVAARGLLGLKQEDLAEAAGVSVATIQNFEAGRHGARPSTIERLRRELERRGIVFTNGDKPGVQHDPDKAVSLHETAQS